MSISEEANDPNLGKFSKLLKCLTREQKQPGGLSARDWNQWQAGQFPQGWNNQNPGWTRPGVNNQNNNNWDNYNNNNNNNNNNNQNNMPRQNQPMPGVHPDDFRRNNGMPNNQNNMWNNNMNNMNNRPPPPQGPQGPPPEWEKEQRRRNKNQRRKNQGGGNQNNMNQQNNPLNTMQPPPPPGPGSSMMPMMNMNNMDPGSPGSWGGSMGAINDLDSQEQIINRQYGYAIMAAAVVILGVLMVKSLTKITLVFVIWRFFGFFQVSAIFCCSSSNSTMAQPATTVTVNPPDTFSIYSYNKQPVIGSDTLRSGPMLGVNTETMRSAASPQYRVSDIDPDFARRFREEHY